MQITDDDLDALIATLDQELATMDAEFETYLNKTYDNLVTKVEQSIANGDVHLAIAKYLDGLNNDK